MYVESPHQNMRNGKMKKIGIISPYKEYNYGTVLQAFALQKALEKEGVVAENIRYTKSKPLTFWQRIDRKVRSIFHPEKQEEKGCKPVGLDDYSFFQVPEFKEFTAGFDAFIRRIKTSSELYYPETLLECREYDGYMVGSDQTWSVARTENNKLFFLKGVNEHYPKMSYAPSIGTTHISDDYLQELKSNLKGFRNLSCREKTNCELLSRELQREVSYVLDPTLLLNAEEWNQIALDFCEPVLPHKQYILCYILGEKQSICDFVEKLGKEKGLPVYYIVTRPKYLQMENHLFVTPETFLCLVRDAHTVITDSFHGSLFSINYNTEFYSFTKREDSESIDNDRILELLETMGLKERYKSGLDKVLCETIDYDSVNEKLEKYRKTSLAYLKKCVNQ